ncbi:MAG: macro domain-containing protein [Anaerolineae bacterium]|nr:macro domain-containing protein [Anaerolineae bacterium]
MPIHYIEGDLLENEHEVRAYAIESNTEGLMNTQVAVQFRTRYPRLFESYRSHCLDDTASYQPGDIWVWEDRTGLIVYNVAVFTDPYLTLVDRPVLQQSIADLRRMVDEQGIESLAMPPLGAGMGALNWRHARKILEDAFNNYEGNVYVYVKNKAPERDLEAIQMQIDETAKNQPQQRRDDRSNNDDRSGNRRRRGRRGNRSHSSDGDDNSPDDSRSSAGSGDNSGSTQSGDQQRRSDNTSSEGNSKRRNRRGRRGRGRRGGRNRNHNRSDNQGNQQNNTSGSSD